MRNFLSLKEVEKVREIAKEVVEKYRTQLPKGVLVVAEPFSQCIDLEIVYRVTRAVENTGINRVLFLWWHRCGRRPRLLVKVQGVREILRIKLNSLKPVSKAMHKVLNVLLPLWNRLAEVQEEEGIGVTFSALHKEEIKVVEGFVNVLVYQVFFDGFVEAFTEALYKAAKVGEISLKTLPVRDNKGKMIIIDVHRDELPPRAQLTNNRSGGLIYVLLSEIVKAVNGILVEGELRSDRLEKRWYEVCGVPVFWVLERPSTLQRRVAVRDIKVVNGVLALGKIDRNTRALLEDVSVISLCFSEEIRDTILRVFS